ncbi:hypothetical protein NDU88_001355 [Pleurodeles waltl]|uniref:Uncharacterized protein n=1 Tax=Pleurodeles waltl TaxID=8319 RepID=A0AAV7KR97_PLEWA|nr:hypothetical protein NDU88_001355 [Pleurodeles waltl]
MGRNKTKTSRMEEYEQLCSPPSEHSPSSTPPEYIPPTRVEKSGDKLDLILCEIRDSREIMERKLGAITTDHNLLKNDQHKLVDRFKSVEHTLATLALAQADHDSMLKQMRKLVELLQDRAEDAEEKKLKKKRTERGHKSTGYPGLDLELWSVVLSHQGGDQDVDLMFNSD